MQNNQYPTYSQINASSVCPALKGRVSDVTEVYDDANAPAELKRAEALQFQGPQAASTANYNYNKPNTSVGNNYANTSYGYAPNTTLSSVNNLMMQNQNLQQNINAMQQNNIINQQQNLIQEQNKFIEQKNLGGNKNYNTTTNQNNYTAPKSTGNQKPVYIVKVVENEKKSSDDCAAGACLGACLAILCCCCLALAGKGGRGRGRRRW